MFNPEDGPSVVIRREVRSVKVPHHRLPPLRKVWAELYAPIVEHCRLEVRMNLKSRAVELRTCRDTVDPALLQKAEDFVKAVVVGFDVADALALLRLDDVQLEHFEVKDVRAGLHGDNLSRAVGRLSGSHGKTKHTIENVTRTRLVIADTHVHILGTTQNARVARDALCDLICGSPAAKVYTRIRGVMNRVLDSAM
jgi:RNA-binding protein PNO1